MELIIFSDISSNKHYCVCERVGERWGERDAWHYSVLVIPTVANIYVCVKELEREMHGITYFC
jgi:hypothetical protein